MKVKQNTLPLKRFIEMRLPWTADSQAYPNPKVAYMCNETCL